MRELKVKMDNIIMDIFKGINKYCNWLHPQLIKEKMVIKVELGEIPLITYTVEVVMNLSLDDVYYLEYAIILLIKVKTVKISIDYEDK